MNYKKVKLKPKKEESLKRFHPWIFSGAVQSKDESLAEGEVVNVYTINDEFIAVGHYQIGSIEVRVLSFEEEDIDLDFWKKRLSSALELRKSIGLLSDNNNSYRLVHGEGDLLPGLIIDVYAETAVIQSHSVGMHESRLMICDALKAVLGDNLKNVYYKSETTLPYKANLGAENEYLYKGDSVNEIALENGLKFYPDWVKGQKTGFFVDQRDNRALLEKYSKGRSVLNMFCYTGGFSFYALRGGANLVHSVDSSSKAIMLTNRNVGLNFPDDKRHEAFAEDAFKFLGGINKGDYDLIILDPPAFAKHRGAIKNALQGYKRLNAAAFEKVAPGGIVFTFSCSQVISKDAFRLAVFSAAALSGRSVRILHQLSQPADHPINIYHPEGEYLKGLVLYVE
ncbi:MULTISPECIES: class I SAM-dependent rRNA methyltransferase [Dysgonomonas]|uniref:class I SAM-dependent rRNA methyltransferase n=1 Tax=Dysgonomonas TaxID=156973 RepID=UPI00092A09FB|nr:MULTISPECIES: class I SAM-dependent rRNA methyltransferase [Dysgonomonas]MBN9302738.1 class I SAM-dependent rRNA methyltransferase [Dysgonomonas mossii]MBS5796292.1 class I SAM-dependent rRNA methyltransferase [Dysgonomonas mossii]MBS5978798.1 class I SAM-dependent rRNA methyltransferase [Dysgonomonas mossii]MBS7110277.1 class I SAM-dependent rRNA methyltransferase [Dysgonomonas mossii]OJX59797.1 MAG: rRNA large subunit methyltransferase I [Dysgonomonas sp. 37-18]